MVGAKDCTIKAGKLDMSEHVLAVTPVLKNRDGQATLYGKSLESIYFQRWSRGRVDHYLPSGDDNYRYPDGTVTAKYQLAREIFLKGNYEYFVALEYDMIVPHDAIERLAKIPADICYGLYVLRHPGHIHWNAANRIEQMGAAWLSHNPDNAIASWGNIAKVKGVGFGCTLIRRHVIEQIPFRYWKGVCCDWALAYDADNAGLTQAMDMSLLCGHIAKAPSPRILWPDINAETFVRTEMLQ